MSTKVTFFIYCVLVLGACDFLKTQGSSRDNLVDIFVFGEGGQQGEGKRPRVFLQARKEPQICRRGFPDPRLYYFNKENCFDLGRDEEEGTTTTGANTGTTTGSAVTGPSNNANQQTNNNNQEESETEEVSVAANWFKMGLSIGNRSNEKEWLVIDSISFTISGRWGNQNLRGQKEIASGYCGTDPLYIIPPASANPRRASTSKSPPLYIYEPAKSKDFNNMTIYIDGLPIPTGPPVQGGADASNNTGPTSSRGGAEGGSGQPVAEPPVFVLDRLPNYQVQALARGYWINEDCETLHNFEKSFRFSLSSSFQN